MSGSPSEIESTEEFQSEYELALAGWLRRRFSLLCATLFAISALSSLMTVLRAVGVWGPALIPDAMNPAVWSAPASAIVTVWFAFKVLPGLENRGDLVRAAARMLFIVGSIDLIGFFSLELRGESGAMSALLEIWFLHLVSSLFLPWSPLDSLRAIVPLVAAWIGFESILNGPSNPTGTLVEIVFAPVGLVPGLLACGWRMRRWRRRFRSEAFARGFLMLRREVKQARAIHDSLFPEPIDTGTCAFDFTFRPMRDLGGDYVHASLAPGGRLRAVVVDVTGHGLSAAMTVTRLSGELERLLAEDPGLGPAAILQALNRYVHLVLSHHAIFATAVAVELDPVDGTLRGANAGHPPPFLRRRDGRVERLNSTGIILGAVDADDFECGEVRQRLAPGETVLLYTDGATEARDTLGRMLGIERLEEAMRRDPAPRDWSAHVANVVDGHRAGAPEDDILIATLAYRGPTADAAR
jgi:hypothetical protein